jgi:hypothetical protein
MSGFSRRSSGTSFGPLNSSLHRSGCAVPYSSDGRGFAGAAADLSRTPVATPAAPLIQRIDGERTALVADVVIETEHAVWTLVAAAARDGVIDSEKAAAVVDAAAWFAGARQHYYGVIELTATNLRQGPVLQTRYSRSRDSARLRSATRGPSAPTHVQWGAIQWSELTALLKDCCQAAALPPIERALAQNALDWLTTVGVNPLPLPPSRETVSGRGPHFTLKCTFPARQTHRNR